MVESSMMKMSLEELQAHWVAAQNIDRFQDLLDAETEDGKYKILARLLSLELEKMKLVSPR